MERRSVRQVKLWPLRETSKCCLLYRDHCLKRDGLTMGSYFLLYMLVWV